MPSVIVVGGGLAGLSAAAALGSAGFSVDLYESRGFLGGRATSFPVSPVDESDVIDNCQHVLLRCCVNLLDFYRRLGAEQRIRFYNQYNFIEPGGRVSTLSASHLPAPLHLASSFLRMKCFGLADKIAIGAGMLSIERERHRKDLDRITMMEWLREKHQTNNAIERFWRQILVSAINEDLELMAASHGFQVFWLGMLSRPDAFEMGVPDVALRELYGESTWTGVGDVRIHTRCAVERIAIDEGAVGGVLVGGELRTADAYVCAVPFEKVNAVAPGLGIDTSGFQHSPITGIHLWFDRPVTDLPHAALLDRTLQWMFNKSGGRYVQFVVSASRCLVQLSRAGSGRPRSARWRGIFSVDARSQARAGASDQGIARDIFRGAWIRGLPAGRRDTNSRTLSGWRLDPLRVAGDHGGRGAQRISRRRSRGRGCGKSREVRAARHRLV